MMHRTHISVPIDLLERLDRRVGKYGRAEFIRGTVERALNMLDDVDAIRAEVANSDSKD